MPLNLGDLSFAALDLEVRDDSALFADENDSWEVRGNREDDVEVIVRP